MIFDRSVWSVTSPPKHPDRRRSSYVFTRFTDRLDRIDVFGGLYGKFGECIPETDIVIRAVFVVGWPPLRARHVRIDYLDRNKSPLRDSRYETDWVGCSSAKRTK